MKRWMLAGAALSFLTLSACHEAPPAEDPASVRKQQEAEIARLEEQVKSYDLLNSIVDGSERPRDKEGAAKRDEIDRRLAELRAQVGR